MLSAVRRCNSKLIVLIIALSSAAVIFINTLITSLIYSSSPSSSVQLFNASHRLSSAALVRIDPPDPLKPLSPARLVLTLDVAELADFVDSYKHGFAAEAVRYPDDGGILLHNPDLCRGRALDWVVYVHTSPGHRSRRELLRDTWANHQLFTQLNFRVVFLLGKPPPESSNLQASHT